MGKMLIFITCTLLFVSVHYAKVSTAASAATIDGFSGKSCAQCHRSKLTAPFVHGALAGDTCTPCHKLTNGNHQSNHWLTEVKERSARLCYECHENRSGQKSVHAPILDNNCLCCHAPHAGNYKYLLKFASKGLCFECHERAMVKETNAREATAFRNGGQNLHYLHAEKNEVLCLTCHDAHASAQKHLIRLKGISNNTMVTITIVVTATGGSCTTSCHAASGYLRQ